MHAADGAVTARREATPRPATPVSAASRSVRNRVNKTYDASLANGTRFHIIRRGRKATARIENETVIVESGSRCQPNHESLSAANRRTQLDLLDRGILVEDGDGWKFVEDQPFKSPSAAASVILGLSANGRTEFVNEAGQTLGEMTRVHSES